MAEPQTKAAVKCRMISPQFVVPDVVAAAEYYRDILGFHICGYFLDPPIYAIVARDSVEIHFGKGDAGSAVSPNIRRREGSLDAYIWVNDLDPLYAELKQRGAKIVEAPAMRVYECYEMVVEDALGFRLAFGMDVSSRPGAPAQP
jgi:catechol 2,3-dioxygenase-like lactoylglutathione lyase family enzyme